jgi:coenzyme PQQ precursor peptide PqqA
LVREVPFNEDVMSVVFGGGTKTMEWTAPKFEEVALNCEINSYASAAL